MKTVYIIFAFCAGLFFGHLFFPSEKEIKPPAVAEILKDKKQLDKIDTAFSTHQVVYQKQNDSLLKELKGYKFLLAYARKELSGKREKTFALVNKIKHDTVFRPDTLLMDSLQEQITTVDQATDTLIIHYQQKDSLMQRMVAIRDSQIVFCNQSVVELKTLAQDQMQREQKLADDLNTALKQQKQKRLQNKILAAGMLFISGIFTTLYIKSRQ